MRASGLKRPTPVGQGDGPAKKGGASASADPALKRNASAADSAPDNDPIAITIQQREALGGLNNQITDVEAQKKKFKIFRAPRLNGKGAHFIDLVEGVSGDAGAGAGRPATAASRSATVARKPVGGSARPGARPATAAVGKKTASAAGAAASEETSVSVNENLADANDPIAVAIQDRLKAGGLASTVKEADAKKQGIPMNKLPKHAVKAGQSLITLVQEGSGAAAGSQRSARPAATSKANNKQASPGRKAPGAASKSSGLVIKPKATTSTQAGGQEAACQLDGDLSNDPIAQTMAIRVQLGGLSNNATDADAKRHNYPVFKAAKHPALKGQALQDMSLPAKESQKDAPSSPTKVGRQPAGKAAAAKPSTSKLGGIKSATATGDKKKSQASEQVDTRDTATHEEDPIAAALRSRASAGGLSSNLTAADAKKQKVHVPAALALKVLGKDALISFELPEPASAAATGKPVFSGTPAKSSSKRSGAATAESTPAKSSKKVMPVDESDPIDVAMRDRKVVGGSVDSVISAADVKAQKLQLPKNAPALSVDKPKEALLAVISNEMISTTEEESKAPKQTSTFTKSSSPTTPVATATAAAAEEAAAEESTEAEMARLVAERTEMERVQAEAAAKEEAERADRERVEREAQEQAEKQAREEAERLSREQAEQEAEEARLEQERLEMERKEQERLVHEEADRQKKEEEARIERERQEEEARVQKEKEEQEQVEREQREEEERLAQEEAARQERECLEVEEVERLRLEQEQKEKEEAKRLMREQEQKEREEAERTTREEAERAEQERLAQEEAERLEKERLELEKQELARQQAEKEAEEARLEAEKEAEEAQVKAEEEAEQANMLAQANQIDIEQAVDEMDDQLNELSGLENDLSGMNGNLLDVEDVQMADDLMISPRVMVDPAHVAAREPKKQPEAQPVAAAPQGIEAALIKTIWPYIRCRERIPGDGLIAHEGQEIAQELKQEIDNSLGTISASIDALKQADAGLVASAASTAPFELGQMSRDGIEIIEEMGIDVNDWIESSADNEWSIRTLKIWFFLQKDFAASNEWASWPLILNDETFKNSAEEEIERVIEDFHQYLIEKSANFFSEDPEILLRAQCLIEHLGGHKKIDPSGDDCDSSVGTFVMFVIRDYLEFCGLIPGKKRQPAKELVLLEYKMSLFKEFSQKLAQCLGQ